MSDGANCLKQINSEEIKKIINLIYTSKPENMNENITSNDSLNNKHREIIEYVDSLEKPRFSLWNKIKK